MSGRGGYYNQRDRNSYSGGSGYRGSSSNYRGNYRGSNFRPGYNSRHSSYDSSNGTPSSSSASSTSHPEYDPRRTTSVSAADSRPYYSNSSGYHEYREREYDRGGFRGRGNHEYRGGSRGQYYGGHGHGNGRYRDRDEYYEQDRDPQYHRQSQQQPHQQHEKEVNQVNETHSHSRSSVDENISRIETKNEEVVQPQHNHSNGRQAENIEVSLLGLDEMSSEIADANFKADYLANLQNEAKIDEELAGLHEEVFKKTQEIEELQRQLAKSSVQVELTRESLQDISLL